MFDTSDIFDDIRKILESFFTEFYLNVLLKYFNELQKSDTQLSVLLLLVLWLAINTFVLRVVWGYYGDDVYQILMPQGNVMIHLLRNPN